MRIVHIMKDGSVRDSIEGMVVPLETNEAVYDIIKGMNKRGIHNEKKENIT